MNKKCTKGNMNKKYTSYTLLGVLATFFLLLSTSPTLASGTVLINSNPSGATVTVANTGQNLGVTPYYIDPTAYPSPTYLRLTKSGYEPINIAIGKWTTYLPTYNLKSLSTTTTTAPVAAPVAASAPAPTPAPTPAPAPASSGLIINTEPNGAACYYYGGLNNGKYIGTTPFPMPYMDPKLGPVWIKCVKSGYKDTVGSISPSWANYPYYILYLNKA